MRHLRTITDAFEQHGDRPLFIDAQGGGATLTYAQADALARNAAAQLRRHGLRPGDRLAVGRPNSVDLALLMLGALYAGIVLVPLGTGFGRREVRSILRRAQPSLVVADDGPVTAIAAELGLPTTALDVRTAAPPDDGWQPFDGVASRDVVAIHFTSGTTGTPRGVAHRLSDFVANAGRYTAATGLTHERRFHHTLPMTYMAGYFNLLLLPVTIGASVVVDRAFDAQALLRFWRTAGEHEADVLWLVPTIMAMLLELDRGEDGARYVRERVHLVVSGTAPLDPGLRERFEARYGTTVHDSYGLSETLFTAVSTPSRPAPAGTVGHVLPGVEMAVRDGELVVRSPDTMAGELVGCEDGVPVFDAPPEWFRTGDLGEVGEDGLVRITGRAKEVVIRGGVNVSPSAVERVLEEAPEVERAAVVGVPDAMLGEQLVAVLQLRGDTALEAVEADLKARAKAALQPAQQPGAWLQIDELPKTPTGKVRKAVVRDLAIDRLGLPAEGKGFHVDRDAPTEVLGGARIVDLSHPIHEGMLTFPGLNHPRTEITQLARHRVEGRATRRLVLGTHTGTHLDAPLHFIEDGGTVDELALDVLCGPAVLADLTATAPASEVSLEALQAALGGRLRQPRVLLHLGWAPRFGAMDFYTESPWLARDACAWLVDQGVRLLGMDTPSPDDPRLGYGSEEDSPNHLTLLGAGVVLVEYMNNLDRLSSDEVWLAALPLPVRGADGAPGRVIALDGPAAPA